MDTNPFERAVASADGASGGKITLRGRDEPLRAIQAVDQKARFENDMFSGRDQHRRHQRV